MTVNKVLYIFLHNSINESYNVQLDNILVNCNIEEICKKINEDLTSDTVLYLYFICNYFNDNIGSIFPIYDKNQVEIGKCGIRMFLNKIFLKEGGVTTTPQKVNVYLFAWPKRLNPRHKLITTKNATAENNYHLPFNADIQEFYYKENDLKAVQRHSYKLLLLRQRPDDDTTIVKNNNKSSYHHYFLKRRCCIIIQ